jgi:hypothetical protein
MNIIIISRLYEMGKMTINLSETLLLGYGMVVHFAPRSDYYVLI